MIDVMFFQILLLILVHLSIRLFVIPMKLETATSNRFYPPYSSLKRNDAYKFENFTL